MYSLVRILPRFRRDVPDVVLSRFSCSEEGSATSDLVVLTSLVLGVGVAALSSISSGTTATAEDIGDRVASMEMPVSPQPTSGNGSGSSGNSYVDPDHGGGDSPVDLPEDFGSGLGGGSGSGGSSGSGSDGGSGGDSGAGGDTGSGGDSGSDTGSGGETGTGDDAGGDTGSDPSGDTAGDAGGDTGDDTGGDSGSTGDGSTGGGGTIPPDPEPEEECVEEPTNGNGKGKGKGNGNSGSEPTCADPEA